jgi:hypothetical protein
METGSNRIVAAARAFAVASALVLAVPTHAALVSIDGSAQVQQGSALPLLLQIVLQEEVDLSTIDLNVLALPGFNVTSITPGDLLLPEADTSLFPPVCPAGGICWEFGSVPEAGYAFGSLVPLTLDSTLLPAGTLFHLALDVSAAQPGLHTLQFLIVAGPLAGNLCGPEDASLCEKPITVTALDPIPEPSTWVLLLAGLTLVGARLVRRVS